MRQKPSRAREADPENQMNKLLLVAVGVMTVGLSVPASAADLADRTRIDSFGLLTGQVGYSWNNVLGYVKGGAAVVGEKYDAFTPGVPFASASETRWGATLGAGLEIGFAGNWSVGAEYNHI